MQFGSLELRGPLAPPPPKDKIYHIVMSIAQDKLADCKTVIWNGPMGVFEYEAFAKVRALAAASHYISKRFPTIHCCSSQRSALLFSSAVRYK